MSLDDKRRSLDAWWERAQADYTASKDPMGVFFELKELYETWAIDERQLADMVFAEWLDSPEKCWDGWAMIQEFDIRSGLPAVRAYHARLLSENTPESRGHAEDVEKSIQRLSTGDQSV